MKLAEPAIRRLKNFMDEYIKKITSPDKKRFFDESHPTVGSGTWLGPVVSLTLATKEVLELVKKNDVRQFINLIF